MKTFFSILTLFLFVKSNAQDTVYLHRIDDTIATTKEKALYYKTINYSVNPIEVITYYINGNKYAKAHYSSLKPEILDGEYENYFYNGNTSFKGMYINNNMEGIWTAFNKEKNFIEIREMYKNNLRNGRSFTFYENGKLKRQDVFARDTLLVSTCYDSIGNEIECYPVDTSLLIYDSVEIMPEFPGKMKGLTSFVEKNIIYPKQAEKNGLEGKVVVKFYIDIDGSVKNPVILKDGVGEGCREEVIRVVNLMPKWKPGSKDGKIVRVYYTLPVFFKIKQ